MSFPSNSSDSLDSTQVSMLLKWVASAQPVLADTSSAPVSVATISSSATPQPLVGQYFDQDVLGRSGEILNTFVESGQVWALLIGIVIGYMIRGLTAY